MINKPDCWLSSKYEVSYGPKSQWNALRKLYLEEDLTEEDKRWLDQTTVDEVDGHMAELLQGWHYGQESEKQDKAVTVVSDTTVAASSTENVIRDLFRDIGAEIDQIKKGTLSTGKASEVAKFRTMQIRSMELVLQAGHLEVKFRQHAKRAK